MALHLTMLNQFLARDAKKNTAIINWRNDVRRTLTVIDIITRDQAGLLKK